MRTGAFCSLLTVPFVLLSMNAFAQSGDYTVLKQGQSVSLDAMLTDLAKANVVFVGEEHDHKQGHQLELTILQGLYAKNTKEAFGLEMFERDVQPVVDEFLSDFISESSFLAASRPWPNYKTDYAPLMNFCKEKHIPVVASNAPRRYVSIVSRKGPDALQALPKASKANLAALPYSLEIPDGYNKQLDGVFEGPHGGANQMPGMPTIDNMKKSQMLWDVTMADSIARFVRKSHRPLVHINGAMHSDSGFGAADRLHRQSPGLKIMRVTIRPSATYPTPPSDLAADIADFVIVTPTQKGS